MYVPCKSDRKVHRKFVHSCEAGKRLKLKKIEKMVKLAKSHTLCNLSTNAKHLIKARKYLQPKHMYQLLHRLEDIKFMMAMDGKVRTSLCYRYDALHAVLASCIVLLSPKSKFRRLQELVSEFLAFDGDLTSSHHGIYNSKGDLRTEQNSHSIDTNCVYLSFTPYSKSCYIGETSDRMRLGHHRRQCFKPGKHAQPYHLKANKIGHQKFTFLVIPLKQKVDRKGVEESLIKKYSPVLPLMNIQHNRFHHYNVVPTTTSTRPHFQERRMTSFSNGFATIPDPQPTKVQPFKVNTLVFHSGAGGATAGFLESGKSNVLAAFDNDSTACRIHQALYPLVEMVQYDLHGDIKHTMARIAKVVPRRMWHSLHLHFSPPCQDLSSANQHADQRRGMANILWCLKLYKAMGARYISIENVPKMLELLPAWCRQRYFCEIMNMHLVSELNQSRRRAILSNFPLDWKLRAPNAPNFLSETLHLPNHYEQENNYGNRRSIHAPAFTVVGKQMHLFCTKTNRKVKFTPKQQWAIQGGSMTSFGKLEALNIPTGELLLHIGNMFPSPGARALFSCLTDFHADVFNLRTAKPTKSSSSTCKLTTFRPSGGKQLSFTLERCLHGILHSAPANPSKWTKVIVNSQPSDITNYKAMLGKFTASEASLLLRDGTTVTTTFATALQQLKHGTCARVKFKHLEFRVGDTEYAMRVAEKLKRSPNSIWRLCSEYTLHDLFTLYKAVHTHTPMGEEHVYAKVKCTITRYTKKRFNVHPNPKFYLRVPTMHGLQRSLFKRLTNAFLANLPVPGMVKQHVVASSLFSFTKHQSTGDILCNHTRLGRTWSATEPWACNCDHLKQVLATHRSFRGHVHVRCRDCKGDHADVLSSSFKDICTPDGHAFDQHVLGAVIPYLRQIQTFVANLRRSKSFSKLMEKEEVFGGAVPRTPREFFLYNALRRIDVRPTPLMLHRLVQLFEFTETGVQGGVPTRTAVRQTAQALGKDGYAGAPLDKNGSTGTISCPRLWWHYYRKEVWENDDYAHTTMTPLDAMRIYADKYISADWQSIAPFNFQGTLPYVYIFRKDKDIDLKSRRSAPPQITRSSESART